MPAVKTHTADLATQLVDAAGRILAAEGAAALTLRRLAQTAGTSTMAVYTLFGDNAERIAFHLWAVSHGMVSLELAGHRPADADVAYEESLVLSSWPFLKL